MTPPPAAVSASASVASLHELLLEALARNASLRLRLRGGSMWPFFTSGTVAHIVPVTPQAIEVGEIVLCATPRGFLAHRVMGWRGLPSGAGLLITKGDALPFADEPVSWEAVMGKVVDLEVEGLISWRRAFLQGWGARLAFAYSRYNAPMLLALRGARAAARRTLRWLSR